MGTIREHSDGEIPPKVSIIMGAFNAADSIRQSIDSILAQDFEDWEFVICDDGSQDETLEICEAYESRYPSKFQVIANDRNMKLAATLNRCLSIARGTYIARMDADDIALPSRLTKQVEFLDKNNDVDLIGSAMRLFDERGNRGLIRPPTNPTRNVFRHQAPFCHPTIMARATVFEALGGYNESTQAERVEDAELWFRFFASGFKGRNFEDALLLFREDIGAFRRRTFSARVNAFRVAVKGYRLLEYPAWCYIRPFLNLSKSLVPSRVQQLHRRWKQNRNVS